MARKGKSGWAYGTQYAVPPEASLGPPKKRFSDTFSAASALKEQPSRELTERDLEEIVRLGIVDSQHPIIQQLARKKMETARDLSSYVYDRLKVGPFERVSPPSASEVGVYQATDQIDILVMMITDLRKAVSDLSDGLTAPEIVSMTGMSLDRAQHIKDLGY